jgi:pimeloyl-ACP methyl ester carboxylesterase
MKLWVNDPTTTTTSLLFSPLQLLLFGVKRIHIPNVTRLCCHLFLLFIAHVDGFYSLWCPSYFPRQSIQIMRPPRIRSSSHIFTKASMGGGEGEEKNKNIVVPTSAVVPATMEETPTAVVNASPTTTTTTTSTGVQRRYDTFPWKYHDQDHSYDINYRVEGPVDGSPILLIHGFGANLNHFRFQFPALVHAGNRVFAIDLLGFGASSKPGNATYSMGLYVQLVTDFIHTMTTTTTTTTKRTFRQQQQQTSWIVAGNSIGGLISLGVAEKIPNLVRGVILFNCSGGMTGFRYKDVPVWVRPLLWFFQKVLLGPYFGSSFFAKFKTRENIESILRQQGVYRNQTNVDDELLEILLRPSQDDGAETVFLKTFAGDPGPTPEEILPHLSCPILAIWGGDDPWTPVDSGMHPGTNFPKYCDNFELYTIPHCGHCPHDEAPDIVNSMILSWIKILDNRKL